MAGVAKKLDSKGRLVLGPEFANATVLVEELGDGEVRVQKAAVIPLRESWLLKNKEAMDLVQRGLAEARAGKLNQNPLQKNPSWIDKLED